MFGIGGLEFLIIAIVAILVVGPNELPRVLYNVGKTIGKIRAFSSQFTDSIEQISREGELQDIVEKANKAGDEEMDFRIQQQQARDARRMELGADFNDAEDDFDEAEDDALFYQETSSPHTLDPSQSEPKESGDNPRDPDEGALKPKEPSS